MATPHYSSFTTDIISGPAPLTINFTDTSGAPPATSWSWDFGDSTPPVTIKNPTHTFTSPGSYSVVLKSNTGIITTSNPAIITVTSRPLPSAPPKPIAAYRVKVQSGNAIFESADPSYDVQVDIAGRLIVGSNISTNSPIITTGIDDVTDIGQDLYISTSAATNGGGNLFLVPAKNLNLSPINALILQNVAWPPITSTINTGSYIGASGLNTLAYYPFIAGFESSDILTDAELNVLYPNIQPGQSVTGPTVKYECVNFGQWRTLGESLNFTPVNKAGDTMLGNLILNADPVDPLGAATKQYVDSVAGGGGSATLLGGVIGSIPYQSAPSNTVFLNPTTNGFVLTLSGGLPVWAPTISGSSITIGTTVIPSGGSTTTLAGLTSVTSTSFVGNLTGNASTVSTLTTAQVTNAIVAATYAGVNGATCTSNSTYMITGSGTFLTINLPAAPVLGTYVRFIDVQGNWTTYPWTVIRNGYPIMGLAEDMLVNISNSNFTLVYADATGGWRFLEE